MTCSTRVNGAHRRPDDRPPAGRVACALHRKRVRLLDGTTPRIEGTRSLNTKLAAEQAERAQIARLLRGEPDNPKKEVPTFDELVPEFLAIGRMKNKPSEVVSSVPASGGTTDGPVNVSPDS